MQNHLRQYLPFWALVAVAAVPAHAQTSRRLPSTDTIDAVFKRYDSDRTPGCSVAAIDGGKVLFKKSYGMADPALGVPMSSSSTSWIPYSEARVFVGLALAMLAKDGKIALDEPVRAGKPPRYYPVSEGGSADEAVDLAIERWERKHSRKYSARS